MTTRIAINPEMLRWARERAQLDVAALLKRFPKLKDWEQGTLQPTLKQLESFSKATHAPLGYLFLPTPPEETLPIPDFRTMSNTHLGQPGPDLLDTIYLCQLRQHWYRDFLHVHGEQPLSFVGSTTVQADVITVATEIRQAVDFDLEERGQMSTWTDALRGFIEQVESLGILVMINGVVGSNNKRILNPEEFRGFALVDDLAPIIFINGADTKAAQMFTLAHELAHIWLGQSGVSDTQAAVAPDEQTERWCNGVAAELLVPINHFRAAYSSDAALSEELNRLARLYKVSTLVILRRIYDVGGINREELWAHYREELARLKRLTRPDSGRGDFYRTLGARVSKRFARALLSSALEGQTLFRDAFQMLGIKKNATFYEAVKKLGVR